MRATAVVVALSAALAAFQAGAHKSRDDGRLNRIGPAPAFVLTTQDGAKLALESLRGKIVIATFIFASCTDTCPLLTYKLVSLKPKLGADFGKRVVFVGITVDPERDTPAVLKRYAEAHSASPEGWTFLTGTPAQIKDVCGRYGVYAKKSPRGDVDHTFLTSVIDASGTLRVQYLGVQFDPEELLQDIRKLLREKAA